MVTWGATMTKANGSLAAEIIGVIREGTKKWKRTVKAEERRPVLRSHRYARMTRERGISFKEAAAQILPEAYRKVSGDGALPANARQLMYAARPYIQKVTGRELRDDYFTQILLPDYLNETGFDWNVVYDARGHFSEPHDGKFFGIGTLEVDDYLAGQHDPELIDAALSQAKIKTCGPSGSFGAVLFIEKEGFDQMLKAARIADKFDIAIMSTKGMSVTAARALADEMCHDHDIPLLLLRDFDKAGFSIAGTLQRDTRRYEFQNSITTIGLGLSLDDVEAMELESEYQHHPKGKKHALIANLRENGATEADIAFMFRDFDSTRSTRRVELNAMTSPQFIAFVERKLRQHGIAKVVPDNDKLTEVYRLFVRGRAAAEIVRRELKKLNGDAAVEVPQDIETPVRQHLARNPTDRWDTAVRRIAAVGGDCHGDEAPPATRGAA
jgi:hypothetical protein